MSEEQLKNMYDRTNKLLNGENKDTYGFSPAEIQQLIKETQLLKFQLQQKENIIKEVREYIEEWQRFPHTNGSTHKELKNLMDILDKENK